MGKINLEVEIKAREYKTPEFIVTSERVIVKLNSRVLLLRQRVLLLYETVLCYT